MVTPVADALFELVGCESERRLIGLDPNVRLNVEPDIALWRRRIETFAAHAHLIKASEEDLGLLYPDQDPQEVAGRWLGQRCHYLANIDGSSFHELAASCAPRPPCSSSRRRPPTPWKP